MSKLIKIKLFFSGMLLIFVLGSLAGCKSPLGGLAFTNSDNKQIIPEDAQTTDETPYAIGKYLNQIGDARNPQIENKTTQERNNGKQ